MNIHSQSLGAFKCLPVLLAIVVTGVLDRHGAGFSLVVPAACAAERPLRILLFSGQNNHDWKTTTPKLKAILADSGRFTVEVTDRPDQTAPEVFAKFDLILSDWNAWGDARVKTWPAATREAFLNFIRSGRGHVSIHAGSSSFYDWPEYQQIGGLSWNIAATSHGAPHEFTVQFTGDHPVTHGLSPFTTKDELWLKPGVHPAAQVLATGDGQTLAVATFLGQGRGFALLLGHSADFMATPGFQTLLLRGAEWAASGKVTIRGVGDTSALDPDEVIRRIAAYRFGDNRKAVLALEQLVFTASTDAAEKQLLAAKLAGALSRDATPEGKTCFCQGLSLIGSVAEVPALAAALGDTNLFFHARQALERIPAPEAAVALQAALATTSGSARADLLNSLSAKRAEKALPDITRYVTDADRGVAGAAIGALGEIGGTQAVAALHSVESKIAPELRERFAVAMLNCAESLQQSGQTAEAAALFAKLVAPGQPAHIRVSAFPSHVAAAGDRSSDQVLTALTGDDKAMQNAAIRALRASRQPALLRVAAENLEKLPADLQESVIVLCGECGDAAVLPAIMRAAGSADASVKRAAITAIGLVGDASMVKPLVLLSESASDDDQKVLSEALARLRGTGVDATLVEALHDFPAAAQRTIIRALATRSARTAVPGLLKAAGSGDAIVRREAITALGKLADASACEPMIQLLNQAAESEQGWLAAALATICLSDRAAVAPIAAALPKAATSSQVALVGVLGSAGGSPACAAVRGQLNTDRAEVRLAAVRVLTAWEDAEPLDDLATVVETTSDPKVRALAAQGLNRMAPQAPDRATRAAAALAVALAATTDAAEQRNLLAALIGIPSVPSLKAMQAQLKNPALAGDAAAGLVRIAEVIYPWHQAEARAALAELKSANPPSTLVQRADVLDAKLDQPANLAVGGLATSPDGLEKDGAAGGDQAAIDGEPQTYWDEQDNQKLYILRVQLRERSTVGCLRILGWQHHNYAPKDFEVRCDDKLVKTVRGATYENNLLSVEFPPVQCNAVELKITGYYSQSPGIRELEIYEKHLSK
jgi:type 1 glutamine amidotransferase/HEAT repeat protein